MRDSVSINELAFQLGITTRTIRFWESEGLFECNKNPQSGHRIIDTDTVRKIKSCAELRNIGISVRDIKRIFDCQSLQSLFRIMEENLVIIQSSEQALEVQKNVLREILSILEREKALQTGESRDFHPFLAEIFQRFHLKKSKEKSMTNIEVKKGFQIIELPAMRAVYNIAVSKSPEEEAMRPVLQWLKEQNLLGVSRLFGGDVDPLPGPGVSEYGYGMCATISQQTQIPSHLKEMTIAGGLYAFYESDEDIAGSWKKFMQLFKADPDYVTDRSRLCLEEHVYYGKPDSDSFSFKINLLNAVKKRAS